MYQKLGITHALTTAYHPQSNGQTELANQEVKKHLCLFTNTQHDDWVTYLPAAEFVLNSRIHSVHRMTPFKVMYGYRPDFTVPAGPPTKFPALDSQMLLLRETCREAEAVLRLEKCAIKETFETNKPSPCPFAPRDMVWLSSKDISFTSPSCKLAPWQSNEWVTSPIASHYLTLCVNTQFFTSIDYLYRKAMKVTD
jgi:hypothetical protein